MMFSKKEQRMAQVFEHFNSEAKVFDTAIKKSVLHYDQMLSVLVQMLPFTPTQRFKIIDIGTGTGNVALAVKNRFPKCRLTCLDLAPNMLAITAEKLKSWRDVEFIEADAAEYVFKEKYDAVVSSLTLHHLETDQDKDRFKVKAFKVLKRGGAFINADIITAPGESEQAVNIAAWKSFLLKSSSPAFMKDRYKKYLAEDRPAVLINELVSLKQAGFKDVDVFWKYYNFVVYGGFKR